MYNINSIKIKLIDESSSRLLDISDEEYFGSEDMKSFVSNSSMSLINPAQGGNPSKFLTGFKDKKSGGALELGTAVHRMSLEKDKYFVDDVVRPSQKVTDVMELYSKYLKEGVDEIKAITDACIQSDYYSSKLTQTRIDNVLRDGKEYLDHIYDRENCNGCIVLTQEHKDKLDKCLTSVQNNVKISELLNKTNTESYKSYNEDVFIMKIEAKVPPKEVDEFEDKTIEIWLKAKVDNWSIDFENKIVTLNDLKTTGTSISDFVGAEIDNMTLKGEIYKTKTYGSFEKFHYYRQMAFYMRILKAYVATEYDATEENNWKFKCNMLVVETNDMHYSHVFEVGERWMNVGTYEYESLLKRIAYHKEFGYDSFTNIVLNGVTIIW